MYGEIAALAAAAAWAFASVLWTRLGARTHEVVLNFLKCSIAATLLALTLLALDGRLWPDGLARADFGWLALSGLAGLTLGDSAYFFALTRIGPRRALLIWATAPGVSALLAWPMVGEPIDGLMLLGMTITLAGVVWVVLERATAIEHSVTDRPERIPSRGGLTRPELAGIGFAFIAVLGQSSSNVLVKLGGVEVGALATSVVRLSCAAALLGVWVGVTGRVAASMAPLREPKTAGWIVLATVVGTYIGIWLSAYGVLNADVGVAATLNATSPIFVLPMVAIMNRERLSTRAVVGALVAVAGVAVFFVR